MAMIVQPAVPASGHLPLVSVFMFIRNGARTMRRAIDSVLAQTYSNIEFVIQDGASTDETLDILRSYGDRLKVVSEPDAGPSDGLWRALNRCTGEYVGSCLADEELLPDAVERAVAIFLGDPDVGCVTGDAMITDISGRQTGLWTSGPFNLVEYLMGDYCPYFCSSLFRRDALLAAGLKTEKWTPECIEFELWCRLAQCTTIRYEPGVIAKYAAHADQSSNKPSDVVVHMRGRLNNIIAICSEDGLFGNAPLLRTLFIWGHARRFCEHAILFKRPDTAEAVYRLTKETLAHLPSIQLGDVDYDENYEMRLWATLAWNRLGRMVPFALLPQAANTHLRSWLIRLAIVCRPRERIAGLRSKLKRGSDHPHAEQTKAAKLLRFPRAPDARLRARMYGELAEQYERRGRLKDAVKIWREAAVLNGLVDGEGRAPIGYTHIAN